MNEVIPIESHPFTPWLPKGAKLLMCGTFPPGKHRWRMEFYYPNFINDMWRIMGLILTGDKEHFVDAEHRSFHLPLIKRMLIDLGIALSDTGKEIKRLKDNASDKFLEIVTPIDLPAMLSDIPDCRTIVTTGEKAASVIASLTGTAVPRTGESVIIPAGSVAAFDHQLRHYRMPSSSRAYPLALKAKAAAYASMLFDAGILPSPYFPSASIPL